jgi:hypothetical protein
MKPARKHESKNVLMRFRDGSYWEEWELRFNVGSKKAKPVKFFASRVWRSDNKIALCPFAATSADFANKREAHDYFLEQVAACGGELLDVTAQLAKEVSSTFGHMPPNYSLKRTAASRHGVN